MEPKQNFTPYPTDYNAPMYKTGVHADVLSTTGDLSLISTIILTRMYLYCCFS